MGRTRAVAHAVEDAAYRSFMPHENVLAALEASAARHGARTAITAIDSADPDAPVRRWSYHQLLGDVRRAARLFTALAAADGVDDQARRQPRVALLLPPVPQAHIALWGAEAAGVACPINFQLNAEHIAALVQACGANILVTLGPAPDLDIWQRVPSIAAACPGLRHVLVLAAMQGAEAAHGVVQKDGASDGGCIPAPPGTRDFDTELARHDAGPLPPRPDLGPSTLCALFHTGGTTGAPKLARHSHRNQLHAAWGAAQMFGSTEHDVMLNGFPLFHVAGSFVYGLSTLLSGGNLVLPTRTGLRNAALMARYGDVVQRHRVTLLAAVPTVIAQLLSLDIDSTRLQTVRALLTGGSPLPDALAAAFEQRHGIAVRNILGMTESAGVIAIEPCSGPRTPGACGLPLPYTEVQVLRADGTPAAAGEAGVLRVRGPNVSPGYTDPARDAGTFEDGWLISGDIGHLDADGRVYVTGRAKDVIIRGAHNIDPGLIESVLLRHPAVLLAAAVGAPDAYAGELPVAFVSLKPGATVGADALAAFVAPQIAERPAMPKRIDILPALPVTAVGKVYKPALRVLATGRVMGEQLAAAGLTGQVSVRVAEAASGLRLHFLLLDAAAEPALRAMLQPFALPFVLELAPAAGAAAAVADAVDAVHDRNGGSAGKAAP